MNPKADGNDEYINVTGEHDVKNAGVADLKRQRTAGVNSNTTSDIEMTGSYEILTHDIHGSPTHTEDINSHLDAELLGSQSSHVFSSAHDNRSGVENELSSLFANMALPGHDRRPDEYILVRQTGQDSFAGTVKGNLDHLPTKAEFNASCRLYRDGVGNYYPPPLAFDKIDVPEQLAASLHKLEPKERSKPRFQYKLEVWNRAHAEMGITGTEIFYQTDKNIKLDRNYKLRPEDRYIQTEKYGRREIQKRYEHEFQAGSLLPDILIKTPQNDIHFSYRFAGDAYANKRFEEFERAIKNKYGSDTEIKLKSKSGIMHDSKYLESWERGSADIRFAEFAGENRAHNRQFPAATVNMGRQPDGQGGMTRDRHVSADYLLQNMPSSPWAQALKEGKLWDRVQVLARDGNRYMSPPRLEYSDPEHFTQLMDRVGLPVSMGRQSHANSIKFEQFDAQAAVIVAEGPNLRDVRDLSSEKLQQLSQKDVLIADRNEKGQRTGTYTSVAEYERLMMKLPNDAAQLLAEPSDRYSRAFVRPEPALPPISDSRRSYESRPRGPTVNSL
ncbi:type IV secretion system single-stranded DNA binding effector VirE2 [Rhizobium rhizogenes]|uniref:Single-strand DNA-binding protein VirE2 n=1 Tax=Rhizobium rhizogenes NBRC 13257 TaxID=1220581 RepID=A0AA87QBR9_RHIRH|nr:type IV secretion system single-stranded DNA binding effector VirE2 [Rhizobium rhizogenes]NTG71364.1 type IV secretion system single-stranded DNA binding effector VirE2 [Rhizobium rhizogenes]TRB05112.1 type IV secretion system single-stranded DNA binding effector VirE2 [Rhizobium rhizogenes]TRB39371.1 type IV secretion system single-stranded DNA binding effector VirE2 [Rhizobium rhizogenes]TRB54647.1 type IV secretion system single-stranded DNA binding effector VirE2 [Rhizobium rhizogenes]G